MERDGDEAARRLRADYERRITAARAAYTDLGRYAALEYDAVREVETADTFYVALNRIALRVQRENLR